MKVLSWSFSLFSVLAIVLAFDLPEEHAVMRETVTEVVCETVHVTATDTRHGLHTLAAQEASSKSILEVHSSYSRTLRKEPTDFTAKSIDRSTKLNAIPLIKPTLSTADTGSSPRLGACVEGSPCFGDITYYDTTTIDSNPSACNTTNDGIVELVLALPHGIMDDTDCGKYVTIRYNSVSKTGKVVDKCMGCDNKSVDLSRALFKALTGSLNAGRISNVEWFIHST